MAIVARPPRTAPTMAPTGNVDLALPDVAAPPELVTSGSPRVTYGETRREEVDLGHTLLRNLQCRCDVE